ncbi:hypothetical protein ASE63_03245 [Bosea sp. Root381]|nr:hypothetical protein ASE63_03245 [Bosea sp. Root381]
MTPDLCVIGAGTAGLSIATAAAAFGVPVVLVERDRIGGDVGGTATTALVAAGAAAQAIRDSGRFGVAAGELAIDYARVHDHVQRVLAAAVPNASSERMTALGAIVLRGEGRFISRSTLAVGEQRIKARRFVIATGANTAAPAIPGLGEVPCLTAATLAGLTRRPERLLVLGGSAAGAALAQAMRRLGSEVTLIDEARLLSGEDPEAVSILRRALLREGIALHEQVELVQAQAVRSGVRLTFASAEAGAEQTVEGTHLLVAADPRPAIEALDLELAGIAHGPDGVKVDRRLRSTNRRVYAIGGAAGAPGGGQVGEEHARLVLRNALFRLPGRFEPAAVPHVTLTRPELARIGLSEDEARSRAGAIRVLRWPYAESERAQAERVTDGFVKLVTNAKGRVLGVSIVGAGAGELIATWSLALRAGMTASEMAQLVMPHPTLPEISKRAATSFLVPMATKPGLRRLIGFLRRFG